MNFREVRQEFLDFFRARGHEIVESASLIPQDDPTLLFINSGMAPFKRLFLGEEKRGYSRAADSQKCVRAGGKHNDLDNVGYTARHHTFFEMLGNFSFGDYFKEEAIEWAWELLIQGYRLPEERLYVSVYYDDDEAYRIWEKKIGIPSERIVRLGEKDNFWTMGETGPCGPCSEIIIDQGPSVGCGRPDCAPGCECDRFLEIWNLVFTQFDRQLDGSMAPLPRPNIDTGMGLERITAVVQGVYSNYETDLFGDIIQRTEDLSGKRYGEEEKQDISFRVIADHARAAAFLIGDGVMPFNEGRGYVLRRIIRRAIRFGQSIGLMEPFLHLVCDRVIELMGEDYGELVRSKSFIKGIVSNEESRFAATLQYSMRVLEEEIANLKTEGSVTIPGELAFRLYDTYGLSLDILEDVARDEELLVDREGYERAMSRQRSMSQESWRGSGEQEIPETYRKILARGVSSRFLGYETLASKTKVVAVVVEGKETSSVPLGVQAEVLLDETPFYGEAGGQVGDTGWLLSGGIRFRVTDTKRFDQNLIVHSGRLEGGTLSTGDVLEAQVDEEQRKATARNHSATHLLHAALRDILGDHVKQAGSLVAPDRLRFDFSHFTQVDPEKLREVECFVNRLIRANLPVQTAEMPRDEAMSTGAMAIFEERYGDRVRLVRIGEGASMELCGGTHTERTGDIGLFRVVGESAVAANVRRIEALTGEAALEYDQSQDICLKSVASLLKTSADKVGDRIEKLLRDQKAREREIETLKSKLLSVKTEDFLSNAREVHGVKVVATQIRADSPKELRESADRIKDKLQSGIIVLGAANGGKVMLVCVVTKDFVKRFKAGELIRELSVMVGGKGGGRPDMAEGGGNRPEQLNKAIEAVYGLVERKAEEESL